MHHKNDHQRERERERKSTKMNVKFDWIFHHKNDDNQLQLCDIPHDMI